MAQPLRVVNLSEGCIRGWLFADAPVFGVLVIEAGADVFAVAEGEVAVGEFEHAEG